MKKVVTIIGIMVSIIIAPVEVIRAQDPISLVIKEGIKKVIKAVDLKIQRQQNK